MDSNIEKMNTYMAKERKVAEKVAFLLAQLDDDSQIEWVTHEAEDMAKRAIRGWWEIPGKPDFNERMAHLKKKLKWD